MRYLFALALLATPAAAHPGAHVNPHADFWVALLVLAFVVALGIAAYRRSK